MGTRGRQPAQRAAEHPLGGARSAKRCRGEFIDWVAVGRAIAGEPPAVTLNHSELAAAVAACTAGGLSALEIARRLRIHPRTVHRHRAAAPPACA